MDFAKVRKYVEDSAGAGYEPANRPSLWYAGAYGTAMAILEELIASHNRLLGAIVDADRTQTGMWESE